MKLPLITVIFSAAFLVSCNHLSPDDNEQESLIRAGDRVSAAGDASSAINVYKSALDKKPTNKLPLYLKLGEAYIQAGRLDEAKKTFEDALPYDENDEAKKQLGRLYLLTGQPDPAISIFEGVLLVQKNDVKAYNGLGIANDLKGLHKNAQDYYRKALLINEDNDNVKSNLGLSLAFDGNYEEALKLLQPLGEALGATSQHRHNLALIYGLSGNAAKAHELYARDMEEKEINENLHIIHMLPKQAGPKSLKEATFMEEDEE